MASTTLQCTPLVVGRRSEGCCVGGTATTSKSNSSSRAVPVDSLHCAGFGYFEKAVLSGGGKRRAAAGEPVAVFQSLSRSALFGGSHYSPQHRRREVLPCSNWECGTFSRAPRLQAVQAITGNVEMLEAYEIERKVRDYELDHYGVVNNAIYAQFCQQARTELLENIGFCPDGVTESGKSMAIADMKMKFISPLRSGDRYIVSSRVAGTTAVRLIFEDHIYRLPERELVMSARSTVVVLDQNSGKAGRLPEEIKIKLVAGYSTNCQVKLTNGHVNGNSAIGHVNGSSTSGHVNGQSTNGHVNSNSANDLVNGNSRNGHVNSYSTLNGYVNGNSINGFVNGNLVNGYLNGNSVNGYVNGNSAIDPATGHLTSDHANGSTTNGQFTCKSSSGHVNGNSSNGHVNGIASHSHLISNSTSDSYINDTSTDIHVNGNSTTGHVNGDSTNDHVKGNSSDDTYN